jgi:hypothetical protein
MSVKGFTEQVPEENKNALLLVINVEENAKKS